MELLNRSSFFGFERDVIEEIRSLEPDSYYLYSKGRFVELDEIQPNDVFQLNFRLLGGKGGFGSVLRSFRISKSTNQLMCRDLNGRRIGDVKEEERLKKWKAKEADREKEKARKKKEKYEKLKQGGPKHKFANVDYLRTRDLILDQTEDALEAAFAGIEGTSKVESKPVEVPKEPEASDESDLEMDFITVKKNKRKLVPVEKNPTEIKKPKLEVFEEVVAPKVVQQTKNIVKPIEKKTKQVPKQEPVEKIDYPSIDLSEFDSAEKLHSLGLDHLKHALESHGLKCGGTLEQRAERLFSVKGLKPKDYPKKLLAAKK